MKNIDMKTVTVILTKNYEENPARVVAVYASKEHALRSAWLNEPLKDHYWYEETELKEPYSGRTN